MTSLGEKHQLRQNDRKGCKRDVLDARGHFLLRFCVAGDKPSGGGNHPPW